jgi:hypothetical protein
MLTQRQDGIKQSVGVSEVWSDADVNDLIAASFAYAERVV